MATLIGKGHIKGLGTAALAGTPTISGYVSPNMQSFRLTHNAEVDRIKGQTGEITSTEHSGEFLECDFEFIPEGTTIANAKSSATIPASGQGFNITGLPIVAIGGFTDGLNTNAGNTQPWFYEGGATINGTNVEKWTMTLPLKRYVGITSATVISS